MLCNLIVQEVVSKIKKLNIHFVAEVSKAFVLHTCARIVYSTLCTYLAMPFCQMYHYMQTLCFFQLCSYMPTDVIPFSKFFSKIYIFVRS